MKRKRGPKQRGPVPAGTLSSALQTCASAAVGSPDFVGGVTLRDWTGRWWAVNGSRFPVLTARDKDWLEAYVGLSRAILAAAGPQEASRLAVRAWVSLCKALRTQGHDPVGAALRELPRGRIAEEPTVRLALQVLSKALVATGFVSQKPKVVTVNAPQAQKSGKSGLSSSSLKQSIERAKNLERWRMQNPILSSAGTGKGR